MSNSTEDSSSFTGYMFYEFCDHINVYEDKLNMILKINFPFTLFSLEDKTFFK